MAAKGLGLRQFAKLIGNNPGFCSQICNGTRRPPPEKLGKMADILGLEGETRAIFIRGGFLTHAPQEVWEMMAERENVLKCEISRLNDEISVIRAKLNERKPVELPDNTDATEPPSKTADSGKVRLRDHPAVRDIRAALEPNEREHERKPTYPARSPDLTGAPRHGK